MTIFLFSVRHSVNYSYSFKNIKLKFSVLIQINLRKVLNYFAAKLEQRKIAYFLSNIFKSSQISSTWFFIGGIELTLHITFWAEKSYRLLRFGLKIKTTPGKWPPITWRLTRVGRRRRPLREWIQSTTYIDIEAT